MLLLEEVNSVDSKPQVKLGLIPQLDALMLWRIVVRQRPIIFGGVLLGICGALVFILLPSARYTTSFQVIVDRSASQMLSKQPDVGQDRPIDPGLVDSEVEVVKSNEVARRAVRLLDLAHDVDFTGPPNGGLLKQILVGLGLDEASPPTLSDLEESATNTVVNKIKAKRLGLTYIIEISFTWSDPDKALKVANALADSYILNGLSIKYEASRRTSQWLQDRLTELRSKASEAELAVQTYKAENNIIDTSRGLMSESQLTDVNSQLVAAKAATAEAKARYDQISQISQNGFEVGTSTDILHSDVVSRLRAQFLDLSAKAADIETKYGKSHVAVINLNNQMAELKRSMNDEVRRLAESSRSDYEIALAREKSVQRGLDQLVTTSGATNQAQVHLHDLESTAQTFRTLYDSFLQRFQETAQQQSFPIADARIIAPPGTPHDGRLLRILIFLFAGVVGGAAFGFVIALVRDLMGNSFRSEGDVNIYAGVDCLGILPLINPQSRSARAGLAKISSLDTVLGREKANIYRHSILAPFSRYSETLRNVKVSADVVRSQDQSIVIGMVSSVPKEGKTTISSNLALLCAQMGHRAILIDGDFHNPSLTRSLAPDAKLGLIEILEHRHSLKEVAIRDSLTGLEFIPAIVPERTPNTIALLSSPSMVAFINALRRDYEYILIDLPPVVPVVDVKAVSFLIDRFIFAIEWGQTSRDVVREAFSQVVALRSRTLGVLLNKAEPSALKRFEAYRGRYYSDYYSKAE